MGRNHLRLKLHRLPIPRLGIRCKLPDKKGTHFVHTLNGTAVAITRAMIALLENHQQPDGSIVIPEVPRKWMGIKKIG